MASLTIDEGENDQNDQNQMAEDLEKYNKDLEEAFEARNGTKAATLLRIHNEQANEAMHIYVTQGGNKVKPMFTPWKVLPEIVEERFAAAAAIVSNNWIEAATHLGAALTMCINALQKDGKWGVPIMHGMAADLRFLAEQADEQAKYEKKKGVALQEAERILKKGFSVIVNDRSPPEESKKSGSLAMINQLFKIYFKLNNLRLCGNLIRTIDARSSVQETFEDMYPISQRVTYKFYTGRLNLYEDKYNEAAEDLAYVFNKIPIRWKHNKRLALLYLVPVRMLQGVLPKPLLLRKYEIYEFEGIAEAIRTGNMKLYNDAMKKYKEFFIRRALYFAVGELQYLVYRTLCRRLYKVLQSTKIKLDYYVKCLSLCDVHMTIPEVECILANLIYKGYIKGYIAHAAGFLVVSKQLPFPPVYTLTE